jgi:hypothetical protein
VFGESDIFGSLWFVLFCLFVCLFGLLRPVHSIESKVSKSEAIIWSRLNSVFSSSLRMKRRCVGVVAVDVGVLVP